MAGTSYTRQSTIADGSLISASLFNSEYNQILNAFAYATTGTTGHTHDGSAGQAGAISKIGDQDFKNKIEVSATNNRIEFYSEVGGSPVEQIRIQDGAIVPVTDSDVDLGTTSVRFKDAYVDSVTVTNNIVVAGTVDGRDVAADGTKLDGIESSATADQTNAEIRVAVEAATDSNVFTDADHTKLNAIEASADVTDTANVTAAGALMDSEVTNLAQVKAFDSSDYATAAQGTLAAAALPKSGGAMTGAITTNSTFDGVDIATRDGVLSSTTTTANAALPKAGGTMSGDIDCDGNKVLFSNMYSGVSDLPSATDNHGMFAHVHATGKAYFAHAGSWVVLANDTEKLSLAGGTMSGAIAMGTSKITGAGNPTAAQDLATKAYVDANAGGSGGAETLQETLVIGNTITTDTKIQFRDTGLYINSSADGQLDIVADTEVQIAATTVDLNGILDVSGNIVAGGTVDGRDVATDGTKLDGIEASADVTDATNVTAAGALMDSELTAIASVKALNQGVATTNSPTFSNLTLSGTDSVKVPNGTTAQRNGSPANGMFRYNSTTAEFEGYQDSAWGSIGGGTSDITLNQFTGDGSDTTFTLSGLASENNTFVYIDGVYQSKSNYSVSTAANAVVTFSTAPPNTTAVEVMVAAISVTSIGTPSDNTVTTAKIADNAVTTVKIADNAVTTVKIADNAVTAAKLTSGDYDFDSITVRGAITEDAVTLTGTSTTIDLATATNFVHDLTGATTYTFSNPASTGNATAFTLKIIQDSTARAITWPSSVDWAGGTAPTLTATNNGVDVFVFYTIDGGTTYYGFTAGQAMA
tara:strand:- start:1681 stop:4122 length:2442 start_codon:yes stop_codon:yes gene_type:complete